MKCAIVNKTVNEIEKMNGKLVFRTYAIDEDLIGSIWAVDCSAGVGGFGQTTPEGKTFLAEYDLSKPDEWFQFQSLLNRAWNDMPEIMKTTNKVSRFHDLITALVVTYPVCEEIAESDKTPLQLSKVTEKDFYANVLC